MHLARWKLIASFSCAFEAITDTYRRLLRKLVLDGYLYRASGCFWGSNYKMLKVGGQLLSFSHRREGGMTAKPWGSRPKRLSALSRRLSAMPGGIWTGCVMCQRVGYYFEFQLGSWNRPRDVTNFNRKDANNKLCCFGLVVNSWPFK